MPFRKTCVPRENPAKRPAIWRNKANPDPMALSVALAGAALGFQHADKN
jgi:hypothetical protein